MARWSQERIWAWYHQRPWIRGCNYMSADCANRIDQWQALGFEERLKTTDNELALAEQIGYNSIRVILEYAVWDEEHDGFYERLDRYLEVCAKHGISCMVVLANDCMPPKSPEWAMPHTGEQHFDLGYHGGRRISQHGGFPGTHPHYYLDDPVTEERYYEMVRETVERYREDPRIMIWDVYNEPGNSGRENITLPKLKKLFEIIRKIDPSQPLTCGVWNLSNQEDAPLSALNCFMLEQSDIISYHCYGDYLEQIKRISFLKKYGRPLINTEWLARILNNNVQEAFPLFFLEEVGCYNWGFVAGKYQTYEPWEGMWKMYDKSGEIPAGYDFTKWFHDLFRINHRPYDPREIKIIKEFCALADKQYENRKQLEQHP